MAASPSPNLGSGRHLFCLHRAFPAFHPEPTGPWLASTDVSEHRSNCSPNLPTHSYLVFKSVSSASLMILLEMSGFCQGDHVIFVA